MVVVDERASRIRDKRCGYAACDQLILRQSTLCRHHLGVVHGHASSRTFTCSPECQRVHQRCSEPTCLRLCGGNHKAVLRDGLCHMPGQIGCWATVYNRGRPTRWWLVTCGMCSRAVESLARPCQGTACVHCGSLLLSAEPIIGWDVPRLLLKAVS